MTTDNDLLRKHLTKRFGNELRAIRRLIDGPQKRGRMVGADMQRKLAARIDNLSTKIDEITDRFDDEMQQMRRKIARLPAAAEAHEARLAGKLTRSVDEMQAKLDDLALRFEDEVQQVRRHIAERPLGLKGVDGQSLQKFADRFDDELRFLKTWVDNPLLLGAVSPSSPFLGRMMASFVEVERPGVVIELGPGTGSVTKELIGRGIDASRIVAVEFDPTFCELLSERFPGIAVVEGDAYNLKATLGHPTLGPVAAVVSGLPLFNQPLARRLHLLQQVFHFLPPGAPFIQFSYHLVPPIPREAGHFALSGTRRIWRNIPPARVWCYRKLAA
ncbi:MAG: rRNA adenine N-6-methyltransferase family protein [Hyphomicrobiales bacterium]